MVRKMLVYKMESLRARQRLKATVLYNMESLRARSSLVSTLTILAPVLWIGRVSP
jgi:hypothetical protein